MSKAESIRAMLAMQTEQIAELGLSNRVAIQFSEDSLLTHITVHHRDEDVEYVLEEMEACSFISGIIQGFVLAEVK